jgi:hypothetical protein
VRVAPVGDIVQLEIAGGDSRLRRLRDGFRVRHRVRQPAGRPLGSGAATLALQVSDPLGGQEEGERGLAFDEIARPRSGKRLLDRHAQDREILVDAWFGFAEHDAGR